MFYPASKLRDHSPGRLGVARPWGPARALSTSLDYISICKPRIVVLLVLVAVVTAVVAAGGEPSWARVGLLAVTGALASAGSSLLNNYMDRDIDAVMERTKHRALPARRVQPDVALAIGIALMALATATSLILNYLVTVFVLSGAAVYTLLYTWWLKRKTSLNIVVGGLAGSCAVLGGWFAVSSEISAVPVLLAVILFLWTPSHFWSFALVHQESYRKAGVPMLPLVAGEKKTTTLVLLHTVLLIAASIVMYFATPLGPVYLAVVLVFATVFLTSSLALCKSFNRKKAWSNYKLSGLYLLALFLAIFLDVMIR